MGQYWMVCNLTKREFLYPHKLGCGLKLWEQLANHPGTGAALIVLTAAMPEPRGGGDFDLNENWHGPERTFPKHNLSPGPMPEPYPEVARRIIGRWAGDRIALVGDYAERDDLSPEDEADLIYDLCSTEQERQEHLDYIRKRIEEMRNGSDSYGHTIEQWEEKADRLANAQLYQDITDDVCRVIEHELRGEFIGEGWRRWQESK